MNGDRGAAVTVEQIRDRWAKISRRTAEVGEESGTIWNDDALVDYILEHVQDDVAALLAELDRMHESLVNPPQMRDMGRGRYEPDRWPDP